MMSENLSSPVSSVDAKLSLLLLARNEDTQIRKDERERYVRERAEDREQRNRERLESLAAQNKMADSISDMAVALTEQAKDNEHLNKRVDRVEKVNDAQAKAITIVSNTQAGNNVRWKILATGITSMIAITGVIVAIVRYYSQ